MPFDTPVGPAVHCANIVSGREAARRLGVHWATLYQWSREQDDFPMQCSEGRWDYLDIYDWFDDWRQRPANAPHYELANS